MSQLGTSNLIGFLIDAYLLLDKLDVSFSFLLICEIFRNWPKDEVDRCFLFTSKQQKVWSKSRQSGVARSL